MSDEKTILRNRLNKELEKRGQDIGSAVSQMEASGEMLTDFVVPTNKMIFHKGGHSDEVLMSFQDRDFTLHPNAVNQIAVRYGLNAKDLRNEAFGADWQKHVFRDRLNAYSQEMESKNVLIRSVDGQAKAVLSDRYRRMNTAAIFLVFLQAAMETGSVLVDASHGELRDFMEVIHPEIIEIPTENNGMIYTVIGGQLRNSDFGHSPLDLNLYKMNVVCMNGMVSKRMINQVHLGSKIEMNDNVSFAEETVIADTKARALAVRDIMKSLYSPENIQRERQSVIDATEVEIDFVQEIKQLPKLGMLKGEVDLLNKTLMEANPKDGVQGKNTLWKMAQGMTAVANKVESPDRKRDLQDMASAMLERRV